MIPPISTRLKTHSGDHSVRIIEVSTGKCIRTLEGHRRTPWCARFNPDQEKSYLLASGDLSNEVKVWHWRLGQCLFSHEFDKPIASLAFYPG